MQNDTTETQRKVISQIIHSDMPAPWQVLQDYQHKGIDADCFTDPTCTRIYSVLLDMQSRDVEFDEICLMTEFETSPELDIEDLMSLTDYGTSSFNPYHVEAILEQKRLRGIVRAARLAIENAGLGTESHEIVTELQTAVTKVSESVSDEKSIDSCVDDFVSGLFAEPETGDYIQTGIKGLDEDLNGHGYGKNQLCVLAARPGCGKTAFALNVAHRAVSKGVPVGIMSLEMETSELMGRMLSIDGKVQMARFKDGVANSKDQQRLKKAVENSKKWPIYIKDDAYDLNYLLACAKNMHRRHDIKLLVVDYCQLIKSPLKAPREQQVANISRELKLLAKSLKIPVMLLCQINRESEKEGRVPRASDLRESGALEQDADSITFLYLDQDDDKNGQMVRYVMCKQRAGKGYSIGQTAFIRQIQYMGDI